jgi:Holliday junction resolvase RusA-like endonuclease
MSAMVVLTIPLLPPSVNHYVKHPAAGVHVKSKEAKAFEQAFPIFSRGQFVVSQSGRFRVGLTYWPGPGGRGDVDNFNKVPLDCCAKAGMFRDAKGRELSDAWVKELEVTIRDAGRERERGPEMQIAIEAIS